MQHSNVNNSVHMRGILSTPFAVSHTSFGERFFSARLSVPRLSGSIDVLPITAPESVLCGYLPDKDSVVTINGQLRSYNKFIDGVNRLILTVYVKDIIFADNGDEMFNKVEICGHVCKPPVYRVTPFDREITDILLAINRAYGKSDYIPCIAWGRNARTTGEYTVGQCVCASGRMQSRCYEKQLPDGTTEQRTAYELSLSKIELSEKE